MSQNIAWALLLFYLIDYRLYHQYEPLFLLEPQAGLCLEIVTARQINTTKSRKCLRLCLLDLLPLLSLPHPQLPTFDCKANVTPTVHFLLLFAVHNTNSSVVFINIPRAPALHSLWRQRDSALFFLRHFLFLFKLFADNNKFYKK